MTCVDLVDQSFWHGMLFGQIVAGTVAVGVSLIAGRWKR